MLLYLFLGILSELLILFLIGRRLTQYVFLAVYILTKNKYVATSCITLILFPGTVIHELSHLFVAEILGVRTGELSLVPEIADDDEGIRSGSVMISQTDPFRRAIIGLAPLFTGLLALWAMSFFTAGQWEGWVQAFQNGRYTILLVPLLILYGMFAVSNTMFSSPQDLKGLVPLLLVLGLLMGGVYVAGFRIVVPQGVNDALFSTMMTMSRYLGITIGINLILFLFSWFVLEFLKTRIRK